MNLKTGFSALLVSASVAICGTAIASVNVGDVAPAFTLAAASGKSVSLKDYAGKHVVLEWTNADCPFVRKHYDSKNMQSLQKEFTDEGVVWLSVISSAPGKQGHVDAKTANKLSADRDAAPSEVVFDPKGDVGRAYGAKTTPHMFIVNPEGKVVYAGGIDSIPSANASDIEKATPYVKVALTQALAGEAITDSNTRPYGCSVKY